MKFKKIIFTVLVMLMSIQSFNAGWFTDYPTWTKEEYLGLGEYIEWEDNDPEKGICKVKDGINTLPDGLFIGCDFIKEIDFNQVTNIGEKTCQGCKNLIRINTGNANKISAHAFEDCETLETVIMDNVNRVGAAAFESCSRLKEISMKNAKTIADQAFNFCKKLTEIDAPLLRYVGEFAFSNSGIQIAKLPKVEYIDYNSFANCDLKELHLSPKFTANDGAFTGCDNLELVFPNLPNRIRVEKSAFWRHSCNDVKHKYKDKPTTITSLKPNRERIDIPEVVFFDGMYGYTDCMGVDFREHGAAYFKDFPAKKIIFEGKEILYATKFKSCRSLEQVDLDFDLSEEDAQKFLNMSQEMKEFYRDSGKTFDKFISHPIFKDCVRLRALNIRRQAYDMIGAELQKAGKGDSPEVINKVIANIFNIHRDVKINQI